MIPDNIVLCSSCGGRMEKCPSLTRAFNIKNILVVVTLRRIDVNIEDVNVCAPCLGKLLKAELEHQHQEGA